MGKTPNGDSGGGKSSFWTSVPGILTATAALITAVATLIGVLKATDTIETSDAPDLPAQDSELVESTTTERKTVGSDVVLVDTNGELELPDVTNRTSVEYVCKEVGDSAYQTTAIAGSKEVTLINWTKAVSEEYLPAERCDIVTEKFQIFNDSENLDFLTTGRMNGENVICVAASDGDCNRSLLDNGLLFTITSGGNPGEVLLNLLNLGLAKDVPPINESTGDRIYINVHSLIEASGSDNASPPAVSSEESLPNTSPENEETCLFGCEN